MNWERIAYGIIAVLSGTVLGALIGVGILGRLFIRSTGFDAIADALGYAMVGAGVAFLGLLYLAWYWSLVTLRRWAVGLGLGALASIGLLVWYNQRKNEARDATSDLRPRTEVISLPAETNLAGSPVAPPASLAAESGKIPEDPRVVGYGFARVPFSSSGLRLLFYATPDFNARPVDSLVYASGDQLMYAPPSLVPYYHKPDYQLLFFSLTSVHPRRVELLTNAGAGQRHWVDRDAVTILFWPDFLCTVFAVEPLSPENYPLRERPLDHSAPLTVDYGEIILLPQYAQGDWLRVMLTSDGTPTERMAWLRWRHEQRLLVRWSYLS